MRIGVTPRFEKSKFGDPWFAYDKNLLDALTNLHEIELIRPKKNLNSIEIDCLLLIYAR